MTDSRTMGVFGPISIPGQGAIRRHYRNFILEEMRTKPESHIEIIVDLAMATIHREKELDPLKTVANSMGYVKTEMEL